MKSIIKRYTVYKYPSFHGSPKHFNSHLMAWTYGILTSLLLFGCVSMELQDNLTGKYIVNWI